LKSFIVCAALTGIFSRCVCAEETLPKYVSMGSSYAAGPGITPTSNAVESTCGRSTENYAHKLARRRNFALTDVSCGGATTADVLDKEQFGLKPQIEAVTADTMLVTVTIGGNDLQYIGTMVAMACQQEPSIDAESRSRYCVTPARERTKEGVSLLKTNLFRIASQVNQQAPRSQLVFVSYLPVLPKSGTCSRLKLTSEEADWLRWIINQLNEITQSVAADTHSQFLNALELGRSHDACAVDPWTNGFSVPKKNVALQPAPFHPNEAGMSAIATELDTMLTK